MESIFNTMKRKKADIDSQTMFWIIVGLLILAALLLITIFFSKSGSPIIDRIKSIFHIYR